MASDVVFSPVDLCDVCIELGPGATLEDYILKKAEYDKTTERLFGKNDKEEEK